jgi:hypothetical protein
MQRQNGQSGQPLTGRVLGDQRGEFADQLRVLPEPEPHLYVVLAGGDPFLVKPGPGLHHVRGHRAAQPFTAPELVGGDKQFGCLDQPSVLRGCPRLGRAGGEHPGVQLVVGRVEAVPAGMALQPIVESEVAQCLPQIPDGGMDLSASAHRFVVVPERLHQAFG